jgi:ABC-type transport system involved in multi-copper enzyme maturation permease subunit
MRAYELIRETYFRRSYIWIAHLTWLLAYGAYWWSIVPSPEGMGKFILVGTGLFLALTLSAGIFGDDIASGRICVLVTKPFWTGKLYLYRLMGLSIQAAIHLLLTGVLLTVLDLLTPRNSIEGLRPWLLASWLLFNTVAALSTTLSTVLGRAFNSLLLLVIMIAGYLLINILMGLMRGEAAAGWLMAFVRYAWPPSELLRKFAGGEYGRLALTVGPLTLPQSVACVVHSLILTGIYAAAGTLLLCRRQFSRVRD